MTSMSPAVQSELRSRYHARWKSYWPENDAFLAVLWFEAKNDLGVPPKSKRHGEKVKELTLTLMKENTE